MQLVVGGGRLRFRIVGIRLGIISIQWCISWRRPFFWILSIGCIVRFLYVCRFSLKRGLSCVRLAWRCSTCRAVSLTWIRRGLFGIVSWICSIFWLSLVGLSCVSLTCGSGCCRVVILAWICCSLFRAVSWVWGIFRLSLVGLSCVSLTWRCSCRRVVILAWIRCSLFSTLSGVRGIFGISLVGLSSVSLTCGCSGCRAGTLTWTSCNLLRTISSCIIGWWSICRVCGGLRICSFGNLEFIIRWRIGWTARVCCLALSRCCGCCWIWRLLRVFI